MRILLLCSPSFYYFFFNSQSETEDRHRYILGLATVFEREISQSRLVSGNVFEFILIFSPTLSTDNAQ